MTKQQLLKQILKEAVDYKYDCNTDFERKVLSFAQKNTDHRISTYKESARIISKIVDINFNTTATFYRDDFSSFCDDFFFNIKELKILEIE